jgi:hypothetical protein
MSSKENHRAITAVPLAICVQIAFLELVLLLELLARGPRKYPDTTVLLGCDITWADRLPRHG